MIRLVGGPHHGRRISYPRAPATLLLLDRGTYHEYARASPNVYRHRGPIGRASWADHIPPNEPEPQENAL